MAPAKHNTPIAVVLNPDVSSPNPIFFRTDIIIRAAAIAASPAINAPPWTRIESIMFG